MPAYLNRIPTIAAGALLALAAAWYPDGAIAAAPDDDVMILAQERDSGPTRRRRPASEESAEESAEEAEPPAPEPGQRVPAAEPGPEPQAEEPAVAEEAAPASAQSDAPAETAQTTRRRPAAEEAAPAAETAQTPRRRRPGADAREERRERIAPSERVVMPVSESPVPRPGLDTYGDPVRVPDRWRIVDALYEENWWDPYNRNLYKGDKPIHGEDWFFNITAFSDTVAEFRNLPTPVGVQSSEDPESYNVFGGQDQFGFVQVIGAEFAYIKGDTVFRPPDYEFRFTPVLNYNYAEADEVLNLNVDPREGHTRNDHHLGIQAAFFDYHIRNVSDRYDFDSIRIGIQPFNADFRGFLFQDDQLGVRLFGTRDNNVFQYNLAWFRRLEKDINSGLNDVTTSPRDDDVFVANLFWQDMPKLGYFSEFLVAYNRNRENEIVYDDNGFIARPASIGTERPREYDVFYLGYSADGHVDRLNLTGSAYYAFGEEKNSVFTNEESDISAFFVATEASVDFDWSRYRLSFLYASGDDDPFDDKSEGFDSIFENPQFAGADTSFWIRQAVPFVGGGRVGLSGRNGILNSLRSSKELGQSNFTNPGIILLGAGADFDVTPELRLSFNANQLWFDETGVLEVARNQPGIDEDIGLDLSVSAIWRPLMSQNIVFRASYAALVPGDGYDSLFPDDDLPQSILINLTLTY